jgi:hypothetical protein
MHYDKYKAHVHLLEKYLNITEVWKNRNIEAASKYFSSVQTWSQVLSNFQEFTVEERF